MFKKEDNEQLYHKLNKAKHYIEAYAWVFAVILVAPVLVISVTEALRCDGGWGKFGYFCLAFCLVCAIISYILNFIESIKKKHVLHYWEDGKCSICGKKRKGKLDDWIV